MVSVMTDTRLDANETDPENADPFRPTSRYPGSRRAKPRSAHEIALDAAAQAEMLAEQLRAIAEAAALPPPEAFAPSLDPDELPEPPFDPAELAAYIDEPPPPLPPLADQTVDQAIRSLEIAPEVTQAPSAGVSSLVRRSQSQTRVDFACRPAQDHAASLKAALETLTRLSYQLRHSRRGRGL